MAQRIGNIEQWRLLKEGERIEFPGELRTVAIEVNAPEAINLYVVDASEVSEEVFLARVEGRDRIEFTVPGDFYMFSDGGQLWFFTTDDSYVANHDIAPVVFTRIANRKDRNPNLEAIEWRMRQNVERRMAELTQEAERRLADVERTYAARRHVVTPPALVGGESSDSSENGENAGQSVEPVSEVKKDAGKSGAGGKAAPGKGKASAASDD